MLSLLTERPLPDAAKEAATLVDALVYAAPRPRETLRLLLPRLSQAVCLPRRPRDGSVAHTDRSRLLTTTKERSYIHTPALAGLAMAVWHIRIDLVS